MDNMIHRHRHLRWQDGKLLQKVRGNKTNQTPKQQQNKKTKTKQDNQNCLADQQESNAVHAVHTSQENNAVHAVHTSQENNAVHAVHTSQMADQQETM